MALHGGIAVSGVTIGGWHATRTEPLEEGRNVYFYDCQVDQLPSQHRPARRDTFQLMHDYRDGAVVLAAKVLERVAYG